MTQRLILATNIRPLPLAVVAFVLLALLVFGFEVAAQYEQASGDRTGACLLALILSGAVSLLISWLAYLVLR
jgi:uncharacterized membrane protein YjgN (DUF898 family)